MTYDGILFTEKVLIGMDTCLPKNY